MNELKIQGSSFIVFTLIYIYLSHVIWSLDYIMYVYGIFSQNIICLLLFFEWFINNRWDYIDIYYDKMRYQFI